MSVDFPAPFGPSNPIVRPERETRKSFKISRDPNRTPSPDNSITGCINVQSSSSKSQPSGLTTFFAHTFSKGQKHRHREKGCLSLSVTSPISQPHSRSHSQHR